MGILKETRLAAFQTLADLSEMFCLFLGLSMSFSCYVIYFPTRGLPV